jgi:hypothetical protein
VFAQQSICRDDGVASDRQPGGQRTFGWQRRAGGQVLPPDRLGERLGQPPIHQPWRGGAVAEHFMDLHHITT